MTTEQICFRYDGSDEAKEGFEVWDHILKHRLPKETSIKNCYLRSNGTQTLELTDDYTLVPPSEFIRLMKGEQVKLEWESGDKCSIPHNLTGDRFDGVIKAIDNDQAWVLVGTTQYYTVRVDELRPIRKSLREEIKKLTCSEEVTNRILELIKERGVEG